MRFFKAFNLLHRRTKSATFVPGISAHTLDFATATANLRSSSFTVGEACRNDTPSSLFDLVTANPLPIPVHFNHLNDTSDRVLLGLWRSRRNSDRNSLASLQSSVNKELSRLSEAVNFWILEYTKIQNLLRDCQEDLVAEKLKTAKFERTIAEERHGNTTLHAYTGLHKIEVGESSLSRDSGILQSTSVPNPRKRVMLYPRTQLPRTSSGVHSLGDSIKPRTLEEYSSALRMTITARKELRDQKKVTKFWKNLAVTVEQNQSTVTPSVSTISSIHEVIPTDRQAAVQALMSHRALSVKSSDDTSKARCSTQTNSEDMGREDATYTLTSSLSKSSGFSRLSPLASESMKQEVDTLFGSRSVPRRLTSSPSRRDGGLEVSKSTSSKEGLSGNASHSLSIESFENISMIFQRAFGLDTTAKRKTAVQLREESDISETALVNTRLPASGSRNELIASSSSTCLPGPCLRSTYSQAWVNINSPGTKMETTILGSSHSTTNIPNQTMKLASKECTSRRSWQKYMAKSSIPNRASGDQLPSKIAMRKSAGDKENNGFSMSLPAFRKDSRLPVPVFTKADR